MFDYKFMLIIIISMVVYFLYRRIENLESKVKKLELPSEDVKPIELKLPEENEFQLPLPEPPTPSNESNQEPENFDTINFPFNSGNTDIPQLISINQSVGMTVNQQENDDIPPVVSFEVSLNEDKVIEPTVEEEIKQDVENEIEELLNQNNNETMVEVENMLNDVENIETLEEFSNEQSEVQIYSNDNEEEHHTSLMESMVEAVDDNSPNDNSPNDKNEIESLLKNNKLAELQQMAEDLSINIHKENNKKKTKLELATDILHSEK